MPTPEELMRQAEAVARVRTARIARENAAQGLKDAILAAVDTGAAITDIAAAAELTRSRVYQLLAER